MQIGDTVIVQGSGAIGMMCQIVARLSGAGLIITIGGPADRLALARTLGCGCDHQYRRRPIRRRAYRLVRAATPRGEGADVVFECAGFLPAFPEGLDYVKQDGTFVEVGHFVDVGSIAINPNTHLLRRNLRLEAIWGSRYHHFVRGLALLERNELPFSEMVSHVLPLERIGEGFEALNGSYKLGDETV